MSFEQDFDILDELISDVQKVQRVAALSISNDVIIGTPVDEGEASGAWQVGINEPPRKQVNESRRASDALADNIREIKKGTATAQLSDLYVTNVKPYIVRLENGWSDQNSHFVAAAVLKAGLGDVKLG